MQSFMVKVTGPDPENPEEEKVQVKQLKALDAEAAKNYALRSTYWAKEAEILPS